MNTFSKSVFSALLGAAMLSSCSRPVAYFQPSTREHFTSTVSTEAPKSVVETPAIETPAPAVATPAEQVAQATETMNQVDAMVRNDSKLAANKTVQKRLNRVRTLLASASAKTTMSPNETAAPKKMSLMERLVIKKMNKKISKQLAPTNPDKAMAIKGVLALGAVVLIAGLLLLLLSAAGSTGATIGIIGIIAGLALLLIGLI